LAVINFAKREIEVKVIYYGPALSGKTTNIKAVHGGLDRDKTGKLHILSTEDDRTLFFDYAPITHGEIAGFTAKFKLFSVPGQTFYKETRRVLLAGADAVVFVADSTPSRAEANIEAIADLSENLLSHDLDIGSIPVILQINKRDLPEARPISEIVNELNRHSFPVIEAVALKGKGVIETLDHITGLAAEGIRQKLIGNDSSVSLSALDRQNPESDQDVILEHLTRIQSVRAAEEDEAQELADRGALDQTEVDAFFKKNVMDDTLRDPLQPLDEQTAIRNLPKGPKIRLGYLHPSQRDFEGINLLSTRPFLTGELELELLLENPTTGQKAKSTVLLTKRVQPTPTVRISPQPKKVKQPSNMPTHLISTLQVVAGVAVGYIIWGILI
jgi:mutual gliding-motility protein MglA